MCVCVSHHDQGLEADLGENILPNILNLLFPFPYCHLLALIVLFSLFYSTPCSLVTFVVKTKKTMLILKIHNAVKVYDKTDK